jgi:hypothetical protein
MTKASKSEPRANETASSASPADAPPKPAKVQLTRNAGGHLCGETMTLAQAERLGVKPDGYKAFPAS